FLLTEELSLDVFDLLVIEELLRLTSVELLLVLVERLLFASFKFLFVVEDLLDVTPVILLDASLVVDNLLL
ncbi:MAG TPA: hypothetical protein DDZ39_05375, partial [Flavobacteriaceae bacterium]|nr:hypothetical protein [Flavobacteriaceae bacterium]